MSSKPDPVVIVCPTEYGGQLEHAADTALALAASGREVAILTRGGGNSYLRGLGPAVNIAEILPPRRQNDGSRRSKFRWIGQVVDLLREHSKIRRFLRRMRSKRVVLVLDTSRYPRVDWLVPRGIAARTVLFVHNARPHQSAYSMSLRGRVLLALESASMASVDQIVVHGESQSKTLRERTRTPIEAVPLPVSSRLSISNHLEVPPELTGTASFALCLGELRRNKGTEVAIAAAKRGAFDLVIAGAPESKEYAEELAEMIGGSNNILLIPRFLDPGEFNFMLNGASVLILAYRNFDAQSGPMAKAMALGLPIVASKLPSLLNQGAGYERCRFVAVGDADALCSAVLEVGRSVARPASGRGYEDWDSVARAIAG